MQPDRGNQSVSHRQTPKKPPAQEQDNRERNRDRLVFAATFTSEPLGSAIEFWKDQLEMSFDIKFAPYNQVLQELLNPQSNLAANRSGMNVILLRFDDWLRYLEKTDKDNLAAVKSRTKKLTAPEKKHLETTFNELMASLKTYAGFFSTFTLLLLCPPSPGWAANRSFASLVKRFEKELSRLLNRLNGLELMKSSDYHAIYRVERIFDSFCDRLGHIPYTTTYYNILATLVMRRFYSLKNKPYKVIALDCDNTLWDGVCGEVGPQGVKVKGLFKKFQQFLVQKSGQGFLLCLCSKNNEADVREVFAGQTSMILKPEDIVASQINWRPKPENLKALASGLNLGIDSIIFLDDNPVECADARLNCPEVLTLQWPLTDKNDTFLSHLWMLDNFSVTEEDKKRKDLYQANVERERLRESSGDFHHFIENLKLEITLTPVKSRTLPRTAQLTNRTNQFNFTTIRRTAREIQNLIEAGTHEAWTAAVCDRFGDYGIVGVMIVKIGEEILELDTFLLSCRVLGRGVEYKMMARLGQMAKDRNLKKVKILYKKTPANEPARLFIQHFAAKYISPTSGEDIEIMYPSEELAALAFEPPKNQEGLTPGFKETDAAPQNSPALTSLRKKEALLVRIAVELSNINDLAREIESAKPKKDRVDRGEEGKLFHRVLEKVQEIFGQSLSLAPGELDSNAEIDRYLRQNSLKIVEITSRLNTQFKTIPPTLLFEHRTLKSIARNIIENNRETLQREFAWEDHKEDRDGTAEERSFISKEYDREERTGPGKGNEGIAIIGINGRFPQARTISEFWENLKGGVSSITEVPANRWDVDAFFDAQGKPGKMYCKWGGFIDDIDCFEASFFHLSPREAETMDPQQRLFMEVVWGLLEDAGYTPQRLGRDTGVFVGVIASDYTTHTNEAALLGECPYRNSDYYQIPNRISYFFDFQGPSVAVDTACSSSGTALYLACQSLRQGDCAAAVVGGVNLFSHPGRFIQYSQMRLLSRGNTCKPFGEGVDGTLMGEGIGALLLKTVKAAEGDGDHIYAVIKGSAINSGGKTNGFTVPNPMAQARLISRALQDANFDAETIGYVEAHGTGTSLGDPIEIRGLTEAFRGNSKPKNHGAAAQYCAIGSVKSNIGHLESGAALAGIIKVVLQMEHQLLVPSLNASTPNPLIPFQQTPFYVQQTTARWEPLKITENHESVVVPRRAGLSSFGAGGVNTHFLLEEYPGPGAAEPLAPPPYIIVISAGNEVALRSYTNELIRFIKKKEEESPLSKPELADIAYTLQVGRLPMEQRLALVVSSLEELTEKLTRYYRGDTDIERLYRGNITSGPGDPHWLIEGREGKEFIDIIIQDRKLEKIAQLWVSGTPIDWELLYSPGLPRRISLPTYPFAGERYWIRTPEPSGKAAGIGSETSARRLHPLLDSNESTFAQQCFKKVLSRDDTVISHHVLKGQMVLPGAAYLEMARAAGSLSSGGMPIGTINNVVWTKPIILSASTQEVFINLYPRQDYVAGQAVTIGKDSQPVIHARWNMVYRQAEYEAGRVDLHAIKQRCPGVLKREACYEQFHAMGFDYGPGYQVMQELYYNESEALSRLELPGNDANLELHPSLLDGALQTVVAWRCRTRGMALGLWVPFTMGEVEIIKPLNRVVYALVTMAAGQDSDPGGTPTTTFDVTVLDETGRVSVRIKDHYIRSFQSAPLLPVDSEKEPAAARRFYRSQWEISTIESSGSSHADTGHLLIFTSGADIAGAVIERFRRENPGNTRIIIVKPGEGYRNAGGLTYEINPGSQEDYRQLAATLRSQGLMPGKILHLWSGEPFSFSEGALSLQLQQGFYSLFYLCRALIGQTPGGKISILYVYANSGKEPQPQYAGVSGMAHSIHRENPQLLFTILEMADPLIESAWLSEVVWQEFQRQLHGVVEIKYENRQRWVRRFKDFDLDKEAEENSSKCPAALKQKGVYLISGGAGGLGLIFAGYLARQYQARLALCGRSDLTADLENKLRKIQTPGSQVIYFQADVTRREEVKRLIAEVKSHFKRIDGIIHSAGAIRDSLLFNKTQAEIDAVLGPKVFGTVLLDEETRNEPLDFFVIFSSISAEIGYLGQSDYAYGNRFQEEFAALREVLCQRGRRTGKTLAINWPYWSEGGMKMAESTLKLHQDTMGLSGLETDAGIQVLEKGLNCSLSRFMLFVGDPRKVERLLQVSEESTGNAQPVSPLTQAVQSSELELHQKVTSDIQRIIFDLLKIPQGQIQLDKKLSDFGFDSITFTDFANRINDRYGLNISPAIFYQHQTPGSFVSYLSAEHKECLANHYHAGHPDHSDAYRAEIRGEAALKENQPGELPYRGEKKIVPPAYLSSLAEPTAIIGISGVFPQCQDIETFWQHLLEGNDLICEVPEARWDWKSLYGHPGEEPNKTDVKWGGFIKDVDKFDASFFGISPREAVLMDPQQRVFLETVWKCIEDAGWNPLALAGTNTGVFVGVSINDYNELMKDWGIDVDTFTSTGINNSIIANRVSYLLDLHGPSEVIDTACSSSLVCIRHALESIKCGDCDMAIAGGVNIMLRPKFHISFRQAGMLSEDGRCKTFDRKADGYVRSEGAAAVLLKSLSRARADGDHIYAVIKGIAENHGGRAQSLTAPNPQSQAEVIMKAYQDARVSPAAVSYIETHGTGTRLGDPIEIDGLKEAFTRLTKNEGNGSTRQKKRYCGLGSVKTNIGHLEAAAGLAGLIKVILAMKHQALPASIHFEEMNPYIDLEDTPFYIVKKTTYWEPLRDENNRVSPRCAGLSSFGFGGTNVHVVLEEVEPPPSPPAVPGREPRLFVLSAKNEERLRAYAGKMTEFLTWWEDSLTGLPSGEGTQQRNLQRELSLADLCYTLQVGREPMNRRLAVRASTIEELRESLTPYCHGKPAPANSYWDNGAAVETTSPLLAEGKTAGELIASLLQEGKLLEIGRLWVSGLDIDWNLLYRGEKRQRVSLPTYPLARESYWLPRPDRTAATSKNRQGRPSKLHPLIHVNRSTLEGIRFSTLLSGEEYYLADHVIAGQKVLPAAAYFDMVRAAGEMAAERKIKKIKNIVWARPVIVDETPCQLTIHLAAHGGVLEFEVVSRDDTESPLLHARGKMVTREQETENSKPGPDRIDIEAVKKRCHKIMGKREFYHWFGTMGIRCGPGFQSIQQMVHSENEALARIQLPAVCADGFKEYNLHPTLMDGALQTIIGLLNPWEIQAGKPYLPFTLGEVELLKPLPPLCYAYAALNRERPSLPEESGEKSYHILLLDETGQVVIRFKDYTVRFFKEAGAGLDISKGNPATVYYHGVWERDPAGHRFPPPGEADQELFKEQTFGTVLVWGSQTNFYEALNQRLAKAEAGNVQTLLVQPGEKYWKKGNSIYSVNPGQPADLSRLVRELVEKNRVPDTIIYLLPPVRSGSEFDPGHTHTLLERVLYPVFYFEQALLQHTPLKKIRHLYVYQGSSAGLFSPPFYEAISGFAKTVHLEHPKFVYKLLEVVPATGTPGVDETPALLDMVLEELTGGQGNEIRRMEGQRFVRRLKEFDLDGEVEGGNGSQPAVPLKNKGVYVITGGTGGLGLVVARYLASQFKAKLVLAGRSDLSPEKIEQIRQLELAGAEVVFVKADITRREEAPTLIQHTKDRFGEIHGILHCAGVIHDAFLVNKTPPMIESVLAPKVHGLVLLDELSKDEKLDWFVLFSSLSGVMGNTGQCDYAYANSFMDHFAYYREQLRKQGKRWGKTLSIAWPLWQGGGMRLNQENETFLAMTWGMTPLDPGTGIRVLEKGLLQSRHQFTIFNGNREKIKRWIESRENIFFQAGEPLPASASEGETDPVLEEFQEDILSGLAQLLGMPRTRIGLESHLGQLGLSSIIYVDLANRLNHQYGLEVIPSAFFQYSTPGSLISFLFKEYRGAISRYYSGKGDPGPREPEAEPVTGTLDRLGEEDVARVSSYNLMKNETRYRRKTGEGSSAEPIAIIGMSGVMPQSKDLETFWQNLLGGKDLVTEITRERWESLGCQGQPVDDPGTISARWGGFIDEVDKFDAAFFNISGREARLLDPQQRIFLQTAWKAIEDAGYKASALTGTRTGVFVGVTNSDYYDVIRDSGEKMEAYVITGNEHSILANRISYLFDWHGPSEPVNTACSSSLVAIHRAVEALRTGRCEMAMAGGVNVISSRYYYITVTDAGMLSRDGRCKTFDKKADGYVRGEGAGALLLKPLVRALRDGDHIYALIKGSAVNHGGRVSSLTVPNADAQAELLLEAFNDADLDPGTLGYIETHGTGTELGDPVEIEGLKSAFTRWYGRRGQALPLEPRIGIGTVKTNIGHLEAAAGIAGVLKVILALKYKKIPGNLHFQEINSYLRLEGTPFEIVTAARPWEALLGHDRQPLPRRAGVSSFGFGGTNAHVVLEEWTGEQDPGREAQNPGTVPRLIILSAKNEERLKVYAKTLRGFLETAAPRLEDIAYTLQVGREPMEERLVAVVSTPDQLKEKLAAYTTINQPSSTGGVYTGNIKALKSSRENPLEGNPHREPHQLARQWVSGVKIDWSLLYPDSKPHRISLPTYPFDGERYWVSVGSPPTSRINGEAGKDWEPGYVGTKIPESLYYSLEWQERVFPMDTGEPASKPAAGILIFDSDDRRLNILAAGLQGEANHQVQVLLVTPGERYGHDGNRTYTINPASDSDYRQLLDTLGRQGRVPGKILHLWSMEAANGNSRGESVNTQLEKGLYSLFYLTRALVAQKTGDTVRLVVAYPCPGGVVPPLYSAVSGFARSLRLENPAFIYKTAAIPFDAHGQSVIPPLRLAELLLRELAAEDGLEVRYDGDKRYVRELKEFNPAEQTQNQRSSQNVPGLKEGGVYLITGGMGALGLVFARYLAEEVKARLVLTGRSPLDAEKKTKINALEAAGAEVLYLRADVSDPVEVEKSIAETRSRFGPINGIIHCAGVIRDAFLVKKTREEIEAVLAAKVHGTLHLDEASQNENLDFFVLFSSIASVQGSVGQCDYAYANRFMDHFAEEREHRRKNRECSGVTISIAWPTWQEGGMRIPRETLDLLTDRWGIEPLPTGEGTRAFEKILRFGLPQCLVVYGNAKVIRKRLHLPFLTGKKVVAAEPTPVHPSDPAMVYEKTAQYLKKIFSDLIRLPVERMDLKTGFEEYGIDSILVNKFNASMEKTFGALSKTLLFEYRNLEELTDYFIKNHRTRMMELLGLTGSIAEPTGGIEEEPRQREGKILPFLSSVRDPVRESKGDAGPEDIAVIGIGGRFPQAAGIEEFWDNLKAGKDCITEVPGDRWDFPSLDPDTERGEEGKQVYRWGGFLRDVDKFDPGFFNISQREAELTDPQERLFLETAWEVLEDAGYTRQHPREYIAQERGSEIGVFVGVTTNDYPFLGLESSHKGGAAIPKAFPWSIANRVSFFFNFHGPSMPVDTGCSSSLTAVHLACESLKKGECSMAIAGGVNLYLHPAKYMQMSSMNMLSPTGRCHTFGIGSDGFVPGEGVGAVLLKPLAEAEKDNDHIYAVIKGTAVNHGGRTNGYTIPNPVAQANLISQTLKKAKLDPRTIGYIEAHGTGTSLGDPIEIEGIARAFRAYTPGKQFCAIGSVKSNIGHLEAAAGIAGLIKVILQMKHRQLVPTLHAETLNPKIDFAHSPVYVQRTLSQWKPLRIKEQIGEKTCLRRAGLSSFGAGGSNAHVLLEEYDAAGRESIQSRSNPRDRQPRIILLSAKNEERLKVYTEKILNFLLRYWKNEQSQTSRLQGSGEPSGEPWDGGGSGNPLQEKIKTDILALVSRMVKAPGKEIDVNDDMTDYGIDPLSLNRLALQLSETYHLEITLDTLLRHLSIESVSRYIYENSREVSPANPGKDENGPAGRSFLHLADLAYTLQVGREPMEERMAVVVSDMEELIERLRQYCRGETHSENLYRGNSRENRGSTDQLLEGKGGEEFTRNLISSGKFIPLARLWVSGVEIDWNLLYSPPTPRPHRISLPTYPFARDICWLNSHQNGRKNQGPPKEKPAEIKPAVDDSGVDSPRGAKVVGEEDRLRSRFKELLGEVLYTEPSAIDEHKPFVDLGLDSVLGVELVNRLNQEFRVSIKTTALYDYPTVDAFCQYIFKVVDRLTIPAAGPGSGDEAAVKPKTLLKPASRYQYPAQGPIITLNKAGNPEPGGAKTRDIAVIGMSGRFPGAGDTWELWENLKKGVCSVTEIPPERWDLHTYYDPDPVAPGKSYCKWGGFIKDCDHFDPLFFNISPAEAVLLEPQQRLFLQEAWRAVENAGYSAKSLSNIKCGVYAGVMSYNEYNPAYMFNSTAILAARIAYFLNLKGPAMSVDTGCSSSLLAIHLACRSLAEGETDMMLAGGVTLYLSEKQYIEMSRAGMLSRQGKCKTFDNSADGFVPAEGVGVVVLKLLDKAIEDGDHIWGVIKGSAVNQDGRTNGITAPSASSQRQLELEVYQKSGVNPRTITYVEAHGTGTYLGDPIEVEALTGAFRQYSGDKQYCAIGSIKSNLGHTGAAAGVASVIKVLLTLQHKKLPPSLHFTCANPQIDFQNSPFFVNTTLRDWEVQPHQPRRAAVSSFGYSGTNAHLVLEEPPPRPPKTAPAAKPAYLITLSAVTRESLQRKITDLGDWLEKEGGKHSIADISYTLLMGRSHFPLRLALVVKNLEELKQKIAAIRKPGIEDSAGSGSSKEPSTPTVSGMPESGKRLIHELADPHCSSPGEYREKIMALADLYMEGHDLDWQRLWVGEEGRRIALPLYPFLQKSYWLSTPRAVSTVRPLPGSLPEAQLTAATAALLARILSTPVDNLSPGGESPMGIKKESVKLKKREYPGREKNAAR